MSDQRDLGFNLMSQQRFSDAIPVFLGLIKNTPNDWNLIYLLGLCYRYTNNYSEAIRFLSKAVNNNPNEPHVFLSLGISQQLAEDYKSAIGSFKEAIRLDPNLFSAYNSLGITYRKVGEFHKALEYYSLASKVIVESVMDELQKEENCFREFVKNDKKGLAILPHALKKAHNILRSDPKYSITKNNMGVL